MRVLGFVEESMEQGEHTHECRGCQESVWCPLTEEACERVSGFDGYCLTCTWGFCADDECPVTCTLKSHEHGLKDY